MRSREARTDSSISSLARGVAWRTLFPMSSVTSRRSVSKVSGSTALWSGWRAWRASTTEFASWDKRRSMSIPLGTLFPRTLPTAPALALYRVRLALDLP